jgi:SOS-response transcriptional repressor LexA
MPIPITTEIRAAIRQYMEDQGLSGRPMADRVGVSNSTVQRWINTAGHKSDTISARHWAKLQPLIAPYLSEQDRGASPAPVGRPETPVARYPAEVMVPLLGTAAAAGYEPALEPLDDFLAAFDGDAIGWLPSDMGGTASYFSLLVEGDSLSPEFPHGTALLVAGGQFPQRGDLVVARLADLGEVVVKEYHRKNGTVELRALNPDGKSYTVDVKAEPGRLVWMWPVVQAKIDLRRRRWEKAKP